MEIICFPLCFTISDHLPRDNKLGANFGTKHLLSFVFLHMVLDVKYCSSPFSMGPSSNITSVFVLRHLFQSNILINSSFTLQK